MTGIETFILSPILRAFFKQMASGTFNDFFWYRNLSEGLLQKLKAAFLTVDPVIEDAEQLVDTKLAVKDWLDDLKDTVYEAEHVLDEIATKALQSKLDAEFPLSARKVQSSIPILHNHSIQKIEAKLQKILDRLETLIAGKIDIGLEEGVGGGPLDRTMTSLVDESDIFGRDNEKEEIIKMLFSNDACDNEVGVVAVVGMGGLGKTTLAQLVYNDNNVKPQFNCQAWVCVTDQFDLFRITKSILEAITSSTTDIKDLEQLQNKLKQELMGKKFLIVLDDVWNQNYLHWENLSKPFKSGVKGSRILVTTRIHDVVSTMRASSIHLLEKLGDKDCWSLFTKHAFKNYNYETNSQLEDLGKQIVKRCDGLPLAIKTIGALLRSKSDQEWNKILKSELWDLPSEKINIIPALKLSYKYLPPYVKRCFAYCAIFPKDYAFEKNILILLWMGEGFLHESRGKTIEEVGDDYFSILVTRSLFQQSSDNKSLFTMHDLVNDLATSVSGQFTVRLDDNYIDEKLNKARHLSYGMEYFDGFKKFEFLDKAKKLCTFLPLNLFGIDKCHLGKRIPHELLFTLKFLRVLSLSNYKNITELPNSIGRAKRLRYLDLSSTQLEKLPDSICELCNLQVLNLSKCRKLITLPKAMWKLANLRHLNIIETGIKYLPKQLGKLECLQTLTQFVINKNGGCSIAELGKFKHLQGSLRIVGLQNVKSPADALDASLGDKQCLNELKLEWDVDTNVNISKSQNLVLDNIKPHANLKQLHICFYRGKSLSNWLGDTSFSKLLSIKLEDCRNCKSLPALGQLPSLESLSISGFSKLVSVGGEFYYTDYSSVTPFKALKDLSFRRMEKWEEWVLFEVENGVGVFSQLEKLCIVSCPKLIRVLPIDLPSLVELVIDGCPQLVASLPRATTLCKLVLFNCKVLLEDLPTGLKILITDGLDAQKFNDLPSTIEILNIKYCEKLKFLSQGMTKSNDYLQELSINECSSSMFLHKDGLPSSLKKLSIENCNNVEFLPEGMINSHRCLQQLDISHCSTLVSLLKGGLTSALQTLNISYCSKLESLPEEMIESCLQHLSIYSCDALKSLPKGGFSCKLKTLIIMGCENFEFPRNIEFLSLEVLELGHCHSLKTFPLDLFPKLYKLSIFTCNKLKVLEVSENYDRDLVITNMAVIGCPNVVSWPKGGLRAPKLTSFHLKRCGKLRPMPNIFPILGEKGLTLNLRSLSIGYSLVLRWMEWGWANFPSVREMYIDGTFEDVESFSKELLLPSSLTTCGIYAFSNLKYLDKAGLQHLNALRCLWIEGCPKLKCMPEQGLPTSVSCLMIYYCPLLEKQWQSEKGKEWRKVAHVKQKWIGDQLIE